MALALGCIVVWPAAGQQPVPAPLQQPPPVFRAGTVLVEVDAIVRDRSGKFVGDLRPGEFEIVDGGEPQRIEAVYLVQGASVTPATVAATAPPGDAPGANAAPPRTQRIFILFFDVDHIAPGGMDRAKKAAVGFVGANFQPGDVGGVVAGGTMVNGRLTSDPEELQAAVRGVQATAASTNASRDMRMWPRFLDASEPWRVARNDRAPDGRGSMLDHVTDRACLERPDDCRGGGRTMVESQVQNKAIQLVNEARTSGQQVVRAMTALTSGLARLPGRKTIVLLTDGFLGEEAWADLRQVVGLAGRANARFYSIDTRGLNRGSASSDILTSEAPSGDALATPGRGDVQADVPNSLAVDTGGIAIRNENDFGKALNEVAADTSSYYVLGYRPTNTTFDGKFRAISVRVTRPGVSVRARKGYVATPPTAAPATSAPGAPPAAPGVKPAEGGAPPAAPAAVPPGAATPVVVGDAPSSAGLRLRPDVGAQVSKLEGGGTRQPAVYPEDLLKKARSGWEAYQRGDVSAARASLSPAAAHASAPPWVRYALGWSLYAEGDHATAAEQWEKVREAVPVFEAVYLDLADGYVQQKEFGRAIATLRDAEKRWPQDVEVYNALGVIQASRGALNDAIATFEKGVAVNPNDETGCYNLAKTLELRYVQGQRDRRASSMVNVQGILTDRDRALEYYRRTVDLKGSFAGPAAEGVKRLTGK